MEIREEGKGREGKGGRERRKERKGKERKKEGKGKQKGGKGNRRNRHDLVVAVLGRAHERVAPLLIPRHLHFRPGVD
jgi:hypothetical protein